MPELLYPHEPIGKFTRLDSEKLFQWASDVGSSDLTIQTDEQIFLEREGKMYRVTNRELSHGEILDLLVGMFGDDSPKGTLAGGEDVDFAYSFKEGRNKRYRFRINAAACDARGGMGCQITGRTIPDMPPSIQDLGVELEIVRNMGPKQGLVLVTGSTGSGKSTLIASLLRALMEDPEGHRKILTFEHPIEYVYDLVTRPSTSVCQHQIQKHQRSFLAGTISSLRRKPSIIVIGEARDPETMAEAITASMTGHLLYTTVHSNDFHTTFKRMVNLFPESERNSRLTDIVSSTQMVISQRLVPGTNGRRVALREYVVLDDNDQSEIIDTAFDKITLACKKILNKKGRSFLEDAAVKLSDNKISKKVYDEVARRTKGENADAGFVLRSLNEKSDKLGIDLSS